MRLFVSVGTDHHPFDRLVGWADKWAVDHPLDEVTVQYGTTGEPVHAGGVRLLSRDAMGAALREADGVVISCGPGGVMDTRRAGLLPIVVPRRSDLGEHVDDHQLAFARHLSQVGLARCVESPDGFDAVLDEIRTHPERFTVEPDEAVPAGIETVGRMIDDLVWSPTSNGTTRR